MNLRQFRPANQSKGEGAVTLLGSLALLLAFGLIVPIAGTGAYLAMVPSLLLACWVIGDRRWIGRIDLAFPILFATAFTIFAVLTVVPNRPQGSALFVLDFLPFVLAIAVFAALAQLSRAALAALIANSALLGTILSVLMGCYQVFLLGDHRADGIGGSAIHYANISLLLGFLALTPLFLPGQWRWHYAAAPFLGIAAALMSGSRSMIPVGGILLLVLVIHLWAIRHRASSQSVWIWVLLAVPGTVAVLAIVLLISDASQIERITAMFDQATALLKGQDMGDNSMAIRFNYYQAGARAFLDQPILGYGWHQAYEAAGPYLDAEAPAGAVRHLHNDILNFAVAFGIFGLIAYLLALAAPIAAWLRSDHRELGIGSYAVLCVVASYFAMGLTNVSFYYEAPKVMFCFAAAAAAALAAHRRV